MRVCAIIPSHNHYKQLDKIIKYLQKESLFVFIIDDGSDEPARSALALLNNASQNVLVHRLDANLGKGGAVIAGMRLAISAGFTHALQIDADGQHDLSVLSEFLVLSEQYPETIICGCSLYDSSAPLTRRIGRWITHIWVWIETLSFRIADSMCGFRIYPLEAVQSLIEQEKIGRRMDFDTDILVRLFWRGVAPIMRPVRVIYPPENTSNFNLVEDNWRIIKMHTRLVLTLLWRLPKILSHRPPSIEETRRWSLLSERGVYWGMKLCSFLCRGLGRRGRRIFLAPIVLYFYITGSVQRQ
ncbi:MAG TPA: acyltransferase, partial [Rhodospirillaceae bacterium]|nr:acyltransferase [Rhodospirillaceae bacterium]